MASSSKTDMSLYGMEMRLKPVCSIRNRPGLRSQRNSINSTRLVAQNTSAIVNNLNLAIVIFLSMISIVSGKCYTFQQGLTILGSEYRKEYDLTYKQCGKACHDDLSCMAFEWTSEKECIFKARSLNGTIVKKPNVHFGLCLDRADIENMRDAFYDHELGGNEYASSTKVSKDECPLFCLENAKDGHDASRLSYTWRPNEPKFMESTEGKCTCIDKLFYIKLSYGSISSYLN